MPVACLFILGLSMLPGVERDAPIRGIQEIANSGSLRMDGAIAMAEEKFVGKRVRPELLEASRRQASGLGRVAIFSARPADAHWSNQGHT